MHGKSLKSNGLSEKIAKFAYLKLRTMYTDDTTTVSTYTGAGVNITPRLYITAMSVSGPPVYLSS